MKKIAIKEYQFTEHYLMRSPVFEQHNIEDVDTLKKYVNTHKFKNALFIASPDLYRRIYHEGNVVLNDKYSDREIITLLNYANRAANKSTPFGLFAGVSVKKWGEIKPEECLKIHVRLDSRVYLELINNLEHNEVIKHDLTYYLNNTIIKKNEEYYLIDNTGLHKREIPKEIQLDSSDHLDRLINYLDTPKKYGDMVKLLGGEDTQLQKFAMEYLDQLIDSRVIMSELTPTILNDFSVETIIQKISNIDKEVTKPIIADLQQIVSILHEFKNIDNDYSVLNHQLEIVLAKFDIKDCKHSLIQIDSAFQPSESEADFYKNIQYTLKEAIAVQYLIRDRFLDTRKILFSQLKKAIERRFGNELVPLSTLFNGKYGSDYMSQDDTLSPPFSHLKITKKQQPSTSGSVFTNSSYQSFLRELYKKNIGKNVIDLSKEIDYKGALKQRYKLPYSMCIYGNAIPNDNFHVKAIAFHANKLIGRFSFCNPDVKELVQDIAKFEKNTAKSENIDLADIDFISNGRISNVSQRCKAYDDILSFLTIPDGEYNSINLSDIGIQLDYYTNDLMLYNLKNNRRILPMLNCAISPERINYQLIRFIYKLTFSYHDFEFTTKWKPIQKEYDYFPRLVFKGIIFQRQTWILRKQDITAILTGDHNALKDLLQSKGIPNQFSINEGNHNDTFIDINRYFSIHRLKSMIKGKNEVVINEKLGCSQNINEVVLPMIKK